MICRPNTGQLKLTFDISIFPRCAYRAYRAYYGDGVQLGPGAQMDRTPETQTLPGGKRKEPRPANKLRRRQGRRSQRTPLLVGESIQPSASI